MSLVTKPLENILGIIFRGVRVDVCINRPPNISACNHHNVMLFRHIYQNVLFLQKDYNETAFESRNSHIYHLISISVIMLLIEIVLKMSYIAKSCSFAYQYTLNCKNNYRRDYLVTQNLFQWNPYVNKCTCRRLNHKVMLITSRDIAVSTFWRPSWTPSWITEKAPAGITGTFSMLLLMVLGRYPEKFSLGILFPPSAWLQV